jgi:hypothetical protein
MDGLTLIDILWDSHHFTLKINNSTSIINNELEFSDKPSRPSKSLVDIKLYKKITDSKEKISACNNWEKWVKIINPYEKIYKIVKTNNNKEFYKYFEIFKYYNILKKEITNSVHFGQTSFFGAKVLLEKFENLNWHAEDYYTELNDTEKNGIVESSSNVSLLHLSESELNLFNIKDIHGNSRFFNIDMIEDHNFENADIITCDISIDTTHDPINQEQLSFRNFVSQVNTSLKLQKKGGSMIIKIYDTFTRPTCQLIYFLASLYKNVEIIKPRSSRYSDSDKFLVLIEYNGIQTKYLEELLNSWKKDVYCRVLGIEIPEEIERKMYKYNNFLVENQNIYINKIFNNSYENDDVLEKYLSAFQNKKAINFCRIFETVAILHENNVCKHLKRKKVEINNLKQCSICINCYSLVI